VDEREKREMGYRVSRGERGKGGDGGEETGKIELAEEKRR
jgi:hypothetical protein